MYLSEGCDDRSPVHATGYCKWETHYCECELTHSLSRQSGLWTQSSCLLPGIHLLYASMRCSWCETQHCHPCQSAWHQAITFSKFWDGNRLVNVTMSSRSDSKVFFTLGDKSMRFFFFFAFFVGLIIFFSRKNFGSGFKTSLGCSGHTTAWCVFIVFENERYFPLLPR